MEEHTDCTLQKVGEVKGLQKLVQPPNFPWLARVGVYFDGEKYYIYKIGQYPIATADSPELLLRLIRVESKKPGTIEKLLGDPRLRLHHLDSEKYMKIIREGKFSTYEEKNEKPKITKRRVKLPTDSATKDLLDF